ncbi:MULTISPECIES: DUF4946 domain-containing protein [unclassified Pseudomonas]|uniref:DUF4946 domain-containing protein n=1 Tax=unclassified Pseudomonas TaxID=196821 RepID=UPI000BA2CAB6|nr:MULTISPECIES: DUF4946 domain-containing protein [unclassified Pseudomonas]
MIRLYKSLFVFTCLFSAIACAQPALPEIAWPSGWQVQALTQEAEPAPSSPQVVRQRAIKNDENGDPVLVMELTMSQVEVGHEVNVQGVLLEMRKSIQKDFFRSGYQSVCNKIHPATLSRLSALETTCTVTRNGQMLLSQTVVAAVDGDKVYVFSYAGQAEAYAKNQGEIQDFRNSLKL